MYQHMSLGNRPASINSVLSLSGLRASDQLMSLSIKPTGISSVLTVSGLRASVQYCRHQACGRQFSITGIMPAGISQYLRINYLRISESVSGNNDTGIMISV